MLMAYYSEEAKFPTSYPHVWWLEYNGYLQTTCAVSETDLRETIVEAVDG